MKFLNYIESQYDKVLAVDTEFLFDTTKTIPEKVICVCYTAILAGEVTRKWEYDKKDYTHHFEYANGLLVN